MQRFQNSDLQKSDRQLRPLNDSKSCSFRCTQPVVKTNLDSFCLDDIKIWHFIERLNYWNNLYNKTNTVQTTVTKLSFNWREPWGLIHKILCHILTVISYITLDFSVNYSQIALNHERKYCGYGMELIIKSSRGHEFEYRHCIGY